MLSSLGAPTKAVSQDVFETGKTDRDYSYFQAVYLFDQTVDFPLLFNLNVSIHPNFSLLAAYANISAKNTTTFAGIDYSLKAEAELGTIGIGYNRASSRWDKLDWLAVLQYGHSKFTYTIPGQEKVTANIDSVAAGLGVRASVTPRIEAQALISTAYSEKEFTDAEIDITSVYRVLQYFDVALGIQDVTDTATYNIGFRYSW